MIPSWSPHILRTPSHTNHLTHLGGSHSKQSLIHHRHFCVLSLSDSLTHNLTHTVLEQRINRPAMTAVNIGMMDGAYFVGRNEILAWMNATLQLNLTRVEEVNHKWCCSFSRLFYFILRFFFWGRGCFLHLLQSSCIFSFQDCLFLTQKMHLKKSNSKI